RMQRQAPAEGFPRQIFCASADQAKSIRQRGKCSPRISGRPSRSQSTSNRSRAIPFRVAEAIRAGNLNPFSSVHPLYGISVLGKVLKVTFGNKMTRHVPDEPAEPVANPRRNSLLWYRVQKIDFASDLALCEMVWKG